MFPIKTKACIHSLGGARDEVEITAKVGDNNYLAEYNGKTCTAIFNGFTGAYYVDDVYGVVKNNKEQR